MDPKLFDEVRQRLESRFLEVLDDDPVLGRYTGQKDREAAAKGAAHDIAVDLCQLI